LVFRFQQAILFELDNPLDGSRQVHLSMHGCLVADLLSEEINRIIWEIFWFSEEYLTRSW